MPGIATFKGQKDLPAAFDKLRSAQMDAIGQDGSFDFFHNNLKANCQLYVTIHSRVKKFAKNLKIVKFFLTIGFDVFNYRFQKNSRYFNKLFKKTPNKFARWVNIVSRILSGINKLFPTMPDFPSVITSTIGAKR